MERVQKIDFFNVKKSKFIAFIILLKLVVILFFLAIFVA